MTIIPDADEAYLSTPQTQSLLTNLMTEITALSSSWIPAVPVTDLYASNNPFDLMAREGNRAFEDILNSLDTI